jgi:putative flippase GtrA
LFKDNKYINPKEIKSFVSFFLTAVLGASVNFLSQIPFMALFQKWGLAYHSAYLWSIFWAYIVATIVSFIPAKLFAFSAKGSGNTKRETLKFLLIALVALCIQEGVSIFVLENIANVSFKEFSDLIREKGSHLVGMGCSFLANYFGHKFLTFRTTGIYDKFKARKA